MALAFALRMAGDTPYVACDQYVVSQFHSLDMCLLKQCLAAAAPYLYYRVDLGHCKFTSKCRCFSPRCRGRLARLHP